VGGRQPTEAARSGGLAIVGCHGGRHRRLRWLPRQGGACCSGCGVSSAVRRSVLCRASASVSTAAQPALNPPRSGAGLRQWGHHLLAVGRHRQQARSSARRLPAGPKIPTVANPPSSVPQPTARPVVAIHPRGSTGHPAPAGASAPRPQARRERRTSRQLVIAPRRCRPRKPQRQAEPQMVAGAVVSPAAAGQAPDPRWVQSGCAGRLRPTLRPGTNATANSAADPAPGAAGAAFGLVTTAADGGGRRDIPRSPAPPDGGRFGGLPATHRNLQNAPRRFSTTTAPSVPGRLHPHRRRDGISRADHRQARLHRRHQLLRRETADRRLLQRQAHRNSPPDATAPAQAW